MAKANLAVAQNEDPEQVEAEAGRVSKIIEVPEHAEWNAVEQVMLQRRSIRKYKRRQVPAHLIRRMLEVARYAPSQGNCQPWKFVVVRDAEMIQGMEDFCIAACKKLSAGLDYVNYPKGSAKHFVTRAKAKLFNRLRPNMLHPVPMAVVTAIADGRFAVFHRAPTVILLLMDKRGIGSPEIDLGICGTNIVLAAHSLGLGTCWIGFSKFLNQSPEWCARLGVEPPYELSEAITVGYPVGEPTRLVARDTHEIAWFEAGRKEILY
ncbi:MAG TPA: nitroreductase family protein [Candidatus Binatia bacterium]|nr:nitroreductase family protein [Candidatus Binatia bacterium]